jgi:hypothetical protein
LSAEEVSKWADVGREVKADSVWLEDLKNAKLKDAESIVKRMKALHQKAVEADRKKAAKK